MSTSKAPSLRVQNTARHKGILQHRRAAFNGALADATSDDRFTAEHLAEQAAEVRRLHSAWGRSEARDAWKEAAESLEGARKDVQRAAADAEKLWRYDRIAVRQQEFAAKLARPWNEMINDTPGRRMHELRADLVRRGDHDGLRALRLAGEPFLQDVRDLNIGDLAGLFRADEAAAVPEELRAAEAEVQLLERVAAELRHEILATEQAVTGAQPDMMLGGLTPWRRQIFGESERDFGGGVVWPAEERVYGG